MDIPTTGAIFTLGKSHLAENTQSYFYIKNDPVKRLISGPDQSAVICESGRLFVWGENHYGQLGIGGNNHNNNNNTNNSSNNNNGDNSNNTSDIVTKPTCVKSLKTLGLKIADIAYGSNWSVILTHSNELFFAGRSIFAEESSAAANFTQATIDNETCTIIRKPFRLEEFDACLSSSEEPENYTAVLAGNQHFAVMTSFGRLIGWGSNVNSQLGSVTREADLQPHEIVLDSAIRQFTCGPESTLVLTESGSLYLTGRLNEFVFPQFTELQKNLSATEQIIFMHISQASEIYIVTNAGSIYRSIESMRNKSLIFQRFYDYDSEENGPIWKLLRGFSFYTVLTKANKFYTTFSESGHHLKTFREISKFKNLRLLDMAVGDKHILVHGIPRSSTLSATIGPGGEHRFMSRTYVMTAPETNGGSARGHSARASLKIKEKIPEEVAEDEAESKKVAAALQTERLENPKPNTPVHVAAMKNANDIGEELNTAKVDDDIGKQSEGGVHANAPEVSDEKKIDERRGVQTTDANANEESTLSAFETEAHAKKNNNKSEADEQHEKMEENLDQFEATAPILDEHKSPNESIKSHRSQRSIKFGPSAVLEKSASSDKLLRPRTPYPESSGTATPQTIKKTPLRNFSYEAAMNHDLIERISPELVDSLEHIPEAKAVGQRVAAPITALTTPTPPTEEDEQLTVEINTTTTRDALDQTVVVNEIRFINNGVDVTANVKSDKSLDTETEDDLDDSLEEPATSVAAGAVRRQVTALSDGADNALHKLEAKIEEGVEKMVDTKNATQEQAKEATEKIADKLEGKLQEAGDTVGIVANKTLGGARDAVEAVGDNVKRMASEARNAVEAAGSNARHAVETAGNKTLHATEIAGKNAWHPVETAGSNIRHVMETTGNNALNAVETAGSNALHAVEAAGSNALHAVEAAGSDARHAVEDASSSAMKAAGGAKNAMGNALFRMADGTKYAVDAVASKISHEMHDAKENLSSLLHGRSTKEPTAVVADDDDASSEAASKDGGAKTNTTVGEDDERTTASVNSNHTSAGNPFESANTFEIELDDELERGKRALRNELLSAEHEVEHEAEQSRGKVRQFLSDMRAKGKDISCRNEKSIRIDDEPPRYSLEDELSSGHTRRGSSDANRNQSTSKVCSIL